MTQNEAYEIICKRIQAMTDNELAQLENWYFRNAKVPDGIDENGEPWIGENDGEFDGSTAKS